MRNSETGPIEIQGRGVGLRKGVHEEKEMAGHFLFFSKKTKP